MIRDSPATIELFPEEGTKEEPLKGTAALSVVKMKTRSPKHLWATTPLATM